VKRDIHTGKEKLKARAILSGHDWQIDEIKKAVKEELGDVETGEDFTWWRKYE
jgi:hypothetical protein